MRIWNCFHPLRNPLIHTFMIFASALVPRKALRAMLRFFSCCCFSSIVDDENSWIIHSNTSVLLRPWIKAFLSRMFLDSSDNRKLKVFFILEDNVLQNAIRVK